MAPSEDRDHSERDPCGSGMTIKLDQYQINGVKWIDYFEGRALLADEQGLGKTIQALYWLKQHNVSSERPAVIVCPATVKWNWPVEAKRFGLQTDVLAGMTPPREKRGNGRPMTRHSPVIMVNYDILGPWVEYLRSLHPQFLILDEGQYIANPRSERYRNVADLASGIPYRVILTGTPVSNQPADLWAPLSIIRPDLFPSENEFLWTYTKRFKFRGRWISKGAQNLDQLHAILKRECMIRRLKSKVLDLPAKIRRVVEVPLSDPQEYAYAENDFLGWVRTRWDRTRARKAKKVESFARLGYLLRLCARLKVTEVRRWIEDFHRQFPKRKLIVFTGNTPMIEYILRKFPGQVVRIDGKVHGHKRQLAVEEFQKGTKKWLGAAHYKAGGIGITLTASSDVLYTDLPLSAGILLQSEDRVHRRTQTRECIITYLVTRGTIEARAMELLKVKFGIIDQIVDGKFNTSDSLDIFNELIKELKKRRRQK